jgi:hypothetical protein
MDAAVAPSAGIRLIVPIGSSAPSTNFSECCRARALIPGKGGHWPGGGRRSAGDAASNSFIA